MNEFVFERLPPKILSVLQNLQCPNLLERHLTLVFNVSRDLVKKLTLAFSDLNINEYEVFFGAGTHDIGKIIERNELYEKGKKHEETGYKILVDYGIEENLSRFTKTHGDWLSENLKIEDLIVSLADKIWKGQRIDDLEEKLVHKISIAQNIDYWIVYSALDVIISEIVIGADVRLNWQNKT